MVKLEAIREPKPDVEEIRLLATTQFSRHGTRIANLERDLNYYFRRFKPFEAPPDDKQYPVVLPGNAKAIVDRAAAQVVSDQPIVTVRPSSDRVKAQQLANDQERWGAAILQNISLSQPLPPTRDLAKNAIMGMWCVKGPLFEFEAWPDRPRRGKMKDTEWKELLGEYHAMQAESFPLRVTSIDPRTVVWDQSNPMNPRWVMERYTRSAHDVGMEFPRLKEFKGADWGKKANVTILEYWSRDWRLMLADDVPVTEVTLPPEDSEGEETSVGVIPNIYHWVPYQLGFGVWGMGGKNPEDPTIGVLFTIEDEIKEHAKMASVKSWSTAHYGMPAMLAPDPEQFAQEMQGPAPIITNRDPKNPPRPMEMPAPPSWIERWDLDLAAEMQNKTFSPAMSGIRQAGMTSGVMSGLHIGEEKQILKPIVSQMNQHFSRILNRAAWISEHLIEEPISVWFENADQEREIVTLESSDWKGRYHFNVNFEPVDPTRDDRRAMLGLNLFAQGAIDPWTLLEEYLRIPDANAVLKKIIKWKILNSPEILQILQTTAAAEAGFAAELEELTGVNVAPGMGDQEIIGGTGQESLLEPGTPAAPSNGTNRGELPSGSASGFGRLSPRVTGSIDLTGTER
jgi:hypothetical protein